MLSVAIGRLPEETRRATLHEWKMLDMIERHIGELEVRIRLRIGQLGWVRLLKTIPGVGEILGATIFLEIGDVKRFPTPEQLASYAGLTPRISSSGGKTWLGPTSPQSKVGLALEAVSVIAKPGAKMLMPDVRADR